MNVAKTNQKGFSIIEVVLVLAIAGLIFLMVFVALPALQRSQRDQGRRSDVGVVAAAINSYSSNSRGKLPTTSAQIQGYVDSLNQYDPADVRIATSDTQAPGTLILVHPGRKCNPAATTPGSITATGASARQAAVRVLLEGSKAVFCQDA